MRRKSIALAFGFTERSPMHRSKLCGARGWRKLSNVMWRIASTPTSFRWLDNGANALPNRNNWERSFKWTVSLVSRKTAVESSGLLSSTSLTNSSACSWLPVSARISAAKSKFCDWSRKGHAHILWSDWSPATDLAYMVGFCLYSRTGNFFNFRFAGKY